MDGLILLDAVTSRPILRSAFANLDPSYALAACDAMAAAISRSKAAGTTVDPIIWLPSTGGRVEPEGNALRRLGSASDEDASDSSDQAASSSEVDEHFWGHHNDAERRSDRHHGGTYAMKLPRGRFCCHTLCGTVRLACSVHADVAPAVPFAFLSAFESILLTYFKTVTPTTLQDNFDVALQLIDTCLSAASSGAAEWLGPTTTEQGTLKEVVLSPGLVARMMAAVNAAGIGPIAGPSAPHPFSSALPWRPNGIKYQSNEIYLDICEEITAILDSRGRPSLLTISGHLNCKSKLSGNPDLLLTFIDPSGIVNPTFHPCVRYSKWASAHAISFVPPDGRSRLMTFHAGPLPSTMSPPAPILRHKMMRATAGRGSMPFSLKPTITVGRAGGSFSFVLSSLLPAAATFSNLEITWHLGIVEGLTANITGGKIPLAPGAERDKQRESGGGHWSWDADAGVIRWRLEKVSAMEREAKLTGTWRAIELRSCPSSSIDVRFEIAAYTLTGIRVDKLKLVGGDPSLSMYKGVRSQVRSSKVEIRW